MKKISILDCTLRDGGYCNKWRFGEDNIKRIEHSIQEAGIDVIECGFLTNKVKKDVDISKYSLVSDIRASIPCDRATSMYVAMINYGEYALEDIPIRVEDDLDGFRIAFHKNNVKKALDYCGNIKSKGYKVFVQPMVTLNYTDAELLEMISIVNEIKPYAFYIVDSFGMMKRRDLNRLFSLIEHNLDVNVKIGFHSHNNMQLAYSNAQYLVECVPVHDVIIDTSIYGMGRGAGNLNTELFADYLNETTGSNYKIQPLLNVIDEVLNNFYQKNYWGYSLPNYLSASYNVHPNYASFLNDKGTLTLEAMDAIFSQIDKSRAVEFDKEYIQELYEEYLSSSSLDGELDDDLRKVFDNKKVLLLAPGNSFVAERDKILSFITLQDSGEFMAVAVNFDAKPLEPEYVFVSNLRRYKDLGIGDDKVIATSNIKSDAKYVVDYRHLNNEVAEVRDNAGLMAIKLLIELGVNDIYVAGIDGYHVNHIDDYGKENFGQALNPEAIRERNSGIENVLKEYRKKANISFVTTSMFS